MNARWSRDGGTLYYVEPDGTVLHAVTIETEPALNISEPRVVIEDVTFDIDVLPGDERFVKIETPGDADARPELRIAVDWLTGLER